MMNYIIVLDNGNGIYLIYVLYIILSDKCSVAWQQSNFEKMLGIAIINDISFVCKWYSFHDFIW